MRQSIRSQILAESERQNLSAYALAQRAGLDPQTVKRYLSDRSRINSDYVSRLCDVLGLELRPRKWVHKGNNTWEVEEE
jgi:transcriptional regulator with XRE-family HTH domain